MPPFRLDSSRPMRLTALRNERSLRRYRDKPAGSPRLYWVAKEACREPAHLFERACGRGGWPCIGACGFTLNRARRRSCGAFVLRSDDACPMLFVRCTAGCPAVLFARLALLAAGFPGAVVDGAARNQQLLHFLVAARAGVGKGALII